MKVKVTTNFGVYEGEFDRIQTKFLIIKTDKMYVYIPIKSIIQTEPEINFKVK